MKRPCGASSSPSSVPARPTTFHATPTGLPRCAWLAPVNECFVAHDGERVLGTYVLHANRNGGGAHVANCGYMTAADAQGRGVARALCAHSLDAARAAGFRAMQFNFVVASNHRAVALWHRMGFDTVGRVPEAFHHPVLGYTDALMMYRRL